MPENHDIKDLLEPDRHSITRQYFGLSPLRALLSILVVVGLGIYVGVLLFGDNSFEVMYELQEYLDTLSVQNSALELENEQLQKEYFELQEIGKD